MTWIKICGITNLEDALTAVDAGADALGFVFHDTSPRKIDPQAARKIVAQLPNTIEKVGVFVFQDSENALRMRAETGLTALQMHLQIPFLSNDGLRAVYSNRRTNFYLAVPAAWFFGDGAMKANLSSFMRTDQAFDKIFLDSGTAERPGGTGATYDWQRAAPIFEKLSATLHTVAAGGLTPGNVTEAIRVLKPWGVDVSSGVEASLGKKDPEKVRAFVAAVRNADKEK